MSLLVQLEVTLVQMLDDDVLWRWRSWLHVIFILATSSYFALSMQEQEVEHE